MSNFLGLDDEQKGGDSPAPDIDTEQLAARVKSGANWFYWIAGLSVINSLIFAFGGQVAFVAGLGFTQLIDAVIQASVEDLGSPGLKAVAIVFSLVFVIVFALAGYFANKRFFTAFVIGVIIYGADTALVLFLLDSYIMAAFHAFALFFMVRGLMACRQLNAAMATTAPLQTNVLTPPPPPSF